MSVNFEMSFWCLQFLPKNKRKQVDLRYYSSKVELLQFPVKGQLISKANGQAMNSSKNRTNEFVFTTMRRVLVRFLEEIEDTEKTFRNYLIFSSKISTVQE